ncbi:hypothetical protein I7I48_11556 [Histoplasma ohiense]|uniref:Uncharacterized protein n=2 Tax=Ajellomyces capsulatus TaxID=5037 RepID=A0A8H7Z200_AJECA|nr:hypothetical protein I7I48_11556 [Histoplasma ohiense (nom. inval.)]KAG5299654.1 hypothetical protein I7I52_10039 [Histoplasma capsulatum]QSS49239.1 hypothetical protein I7I53_09541 [Histoplasma capsulatum var. duboisii H88]QSS67720.1 hypothetical protein I7I50_06886 [Histoplasma capsulatum G186AR]
MGVRNLVYFLPLFLQTKFIRDQTPRFWEFWMLDDVMLPFLRDASMNPSLNFLISWGRGNGLML